MKKLLLFSLILLSNLGFSQRQKENTINKEEFIKQHKEQINTQAFNQLSFQRQQNDLSNDNDVNGFGYSVYYGNSKTFGVEATYMYKSVIFGIGSSYNIAPHIEGNNKYLTSTTKIVNDKTYSFYMIYGYHIKLENEIDEFRLCLKTGVGNGLISQNNNWYYNTSTYSDLLIGGSVGLGSRDFFVDFGYDTYNKVTIGITYVL